MSPANDAFNAAHETAEMWKVRFEALLAMMTAHVEVPSPNWDTKTVCACGERFASRAEWAFHRFRAEDAYIAKLT